MKYKCRRCEHRFDTINNFPYCPACFCESLEEVIEYNSLVKENTLLEEHHIHPKFMDNSNGTGEKFRITKKQHFILHGKIMKWIWGCIRREDKEKTIQYIIRKSKEFLGVKK